MREYCIMFNDSSIRVIGATTFSVSNRVLKFYAGDDVIAIFNLENIAGFCDAYNVRRSIGGLA